MQGGPYLAEFWWKVPEERRRILQTYHRFRCRVIFWTLHHRATSTAVGVDNDWPRNVLHTIIAVCIRNGRDADGGVTAISTVNALEPAQTARQKIT